MPVSLSYGIYRWFTCRSLSDIASIGVSLSHTVVSVGIMAVSLSDISFLSIICVSLSDVVPVDIILSVFD